MPLRDLLGDVGKLAGEALEAGTVRVFVKTNLGPEFELSPRGQGGGILRALGVRGAVLVRDRAGRPLFAYGAPPPTSPFLVVAFAGLVLVISWAVVRGFVKR